MILAGVMLMGLASLFLGPAPRAGAAVTPSQDACHVTSNAAPVGNCGAFKLLLRDTFNGQHAAKGSFSGCAGEGDFKCSGLKQYGTGTGSIYRSIGAYPSGWDDTATSGNDGNGGRTLGGHYRPDDTTWISPSGTDGQLHVKMYRPAAGGSNHVAALVPVKCMGLRYGKFTERLVVRTRTPGFKMAHLRYTPNEVDYPEAGGNFDHDPVSMFTHEFNESKADVAPNSAWTSWHTYSTEIVPGHIRFYLDGKLVKTVNADFPDAADWILQNESALAGSYAAKGSSVQIDTTWLTCYRYTP
jgi:hypothetical protein